MTCLFNPLIKSKEANSNKFKLKHTQRTKTMKVVQALVILGVAASSNAGNLRGSGAPITLVATIMASTLKGLLVSLKVKGLLVSLKMSRLLLLLRLLLLSPRIPPSAPSKMPTSTSLQKY
jgi:hypothetical protein